MRILIGHGAAQYSPCSTTEFSLSEPGDSLLSNWIFVHNIEQGLYFASLWPLNILIHSMILFWECNHINNEKHMHHGFLVPLFMRYIINVYLIIILTISKYTENADNVSHFIAIFFKVGMLNSFKPALAS